MVKILNVIILLYLGEVFGSDIHVSYQESKKGGR